MCLTYKRLYLQQTNISTSIHTWIISPSLTHQGLYIFEHLIIEIKGMNLVYSRCMNDIHFVINIHHWYTLSRQCQLQITKPRTLFQILVAQKIHQDTYPDGKWHDARSIAHILINRRAITMILAYDETASNCFPFVLRYSRPGNDFHSQVYTWGVSQNETCPL